MATSEYFSEYYKQHREKYKTRAKQWALQNPESRKRVVDKYRWSDKGINAKLNSTFKRKYGITLLQYNYMLDAQNNKCAICNKEETALLKGVVRRLAIDHCHITGKVRGLLCDKCNHLLGLVNDSCSLLENAINYLKE